MSIDIGMNSMTGRCLCGQLVFRITAPPSDVHHCHCSMCRRATGAAFATLVWAGRDSIQWTGEPARYRSSEIATRGFCPTCGTSLFLDYDGSSDIALMLGAFDAPADLQPSHHYGIESRLPWADIEEDLPGKPTDLHPQP
jgi:hypothetical protein